MQQPEESERWSMTLRRASVRRHSLIASVCIQTILLLCLQSRQQALGALFSNAQYSQATVCDSNRLLRCQQDVLRDMQAVGLNAASIQYPISQGPPYSPGSILSASSSSSSLAAKLISPSTCRLVRSNLDCLLSTTPACYDQGIQAAQNTDLILRAKRFLEQNGCNEPDTTWQSTFCYRSPEIRSCEERYGFTNYNSGLQQLLTNNNNVSACLSYQAFKFCIDSHLRMNCKVHEMDMANEYLIDRGSDLVWRCSINATSASLSNYLNPYQLSNHQAAILSPSSYGNSAYEQRPLSPSYIGSTNNLNLFSGGSVVREQPWERFRSPSDEVRYGISRYPNNINSGGGEIFDRLVAGNSFGEADSSDCPIKAAPYARECENTLLDQQRLARDSRDGNELQRRVCCSLFQYRDCISRVVLDRCADSSPTAVEVIMGIRRREMTLTCRGFNRDICNGAPSKTIVSLPTLLALLVFTSFVAFKQSLSSPTKVNL